MKIVIDLYDLGFKMHDLTEDEINIAVERHPVYRDRVYYWVESPEDDKEICYKCRLDNSCNNDIYHYCESVFQHLMYLQPYFKRR